MQHCDIQRRDCAVPKGISLPNVIGLCNKPACFACCLIASDERISKGLAFGNRIFRISLGFCCVTLQVVIGLPLTMTCVMQEESTVTMVAFSLQIMADVENFWSRLEFNCLTL